jgi:hypothetical protein
MRTIREGDTFHFNGDYHAFADWMLRVVDSSPDKLALFPMPVGMANTDEEIDACEEDVRRAYDIAKARRRNLSVKILHALDDRSAVPVSRVLVVIHEHKWVGGLCVNGCPDTRKEG